jgi:hypothetical protein
VQEVADRREHRLLLDEDRRVAEAGGELEGPHALAVHDAVEVDVPDVPLGREAALHLEQGLAEQAVGRAPEHRRAHLARRRPEVAREQALVLEVEVHGLDEAGAVEERADRDLHAGHPLLELELLHPGPGAATSLEATEGVAVGLHHPDHVAARRPLRPRTASAWCWRPRHTA